VKDSPLWVLLLHICCAACVRARLVALYCAQEMFDHKIRTIVHGSIRGLFFRPFRSSCSPFTTTMASYYPPPPSSPFAGANLNYNPRPDFYQRPPSQPTLLEQVQANPPDVYNTISVPLPLTPSTSFKGPGWQPPPSPQVLKSPKTFLQWKADSKATTSDYQRNGFPSPVAWVMTSSITPCLLSLTVSLSRFT
jgi:hypothetical protein